MRGGGIGELAGKRQLRNVTGQNWSSMAPNGVEVLGLYRKRSGAMSFEHGAKSERRSVFDTAT
jgi:hypothetical protein